MTERIRGASPRSMARITGVVYLLFFMTAIAGEVFLRQAGITGIQLTALSGDAGAIAHNILAHQSLFQLGFALTLLSVTFYIALTALLYRMLRPVSTSLALIAAFFSLMGLAVQAAGSLFQLAPMVLLGGHPYLSVFDPKQLQALALMFLNLDGEVGYVSLVFDGVWLLLLGYLIFRSTFLPRILGGLVALAGLGWEMLLAPPLGNHLYTYIQIVGAIGEISLMLWLLVMGVNSQRWNERAAPARGTHGPAKYGVAP